MNKKPQINQILRHIIQIGYLFLFPGLFAICFSQIKLIYDMVVLKHLNFALNPQFLFEFFIVFILTILLGRFFCGYICAFGSLLEGWHFISKKIFKVNFVMNRKVDRYLKFLKYILLIFIILIIWTLNNNNFSAFSPWDAIAEIRDFPDVIFMYNVGLVVLVFVIFGEVFIERFFCRYLCPLGAFLNITGMLNVFRIVKKYDPYEKSEVCTQNCPMGIDLKHNIIKGNECIRCFKCIDESPENKLEPFILKKKLNKKYMYAIVLTSITLIILFKVMSSVKLDNIGLTDALKSAEHSNIHLKSNYKDGTYVGIGNGYRQDIEVKVVIFNNRITDIEVIKSHESQNFSEVPFKLIPATIIKKQSLDVDLISGATRTSSGFDSAVEDALNQAQKN